MKKENGRLKPAPEKETADVRSKEFKCTRCSAVDYYRGLQFGEQVRCKDCGAYMEENINI